MEAGESLAQGACFYSVEHDAPARLDFYRARVVDGLGQVIHERLFAVEMKETESQTQRAEHPGGFRAREAPMGAAVGCGPPRYRGLADTRGAHPIPERGAPGARGGD